MNKKYALALVMVVIMITNTFCHTVIAEPLQEKETIGVENGEIPSSSEEDEIEEVELKYNEEDVPFMLERLKGTDQWDSLIIKVCKEENVDPYFAKCIMTIESGGNIKAHNTKNRNGSQDYGLMQVNSNWGSIFDYDKMFDDAEYSIRCGVKVIKYKIDDAKRQKCEPTAFEILWRYNGKSKQGHKYATKMIKLYKVFREESYDINKFEISN